MPLRQEVLNVLLAELLQERGLVAVPEQVLKQPLKSVRLPEKALHEIEKRKGMKAGK